MERSPPASCPLPSSCNEPNAALLQPIFMPVPEAGHKRSRAKKARPPPASAAGRKSSIYRGVTRHRWSGRYEAHLWDKSSWNSTKSKKGKQVYLGAFDSEEAAGRTYDLAALKYWGPEANLNFPVETYMNELEDMQRLSKEEFLALLRRHSSGFSRGVSKYRGVARHHQNGRWEARIGLVTGSKYLYLGTFGTEEEAAAAYDMAALELKGPNAITNFQIKAYEHKLKEIGERSSSSQTNPPPPPLNDHQDNSKIRIEGDNVQVERLFTEEEAHPEAESFLLEAADVDSLAAGKEWCCPWSLCLDEEPPMSLHHQVKPLHFEFLNDSSFEDEIDFVFGKRVRAAAADQFGNDDDDVLGSGSGTQQQ